MFVAYLLPHPTDVFNLLEDGIQWIVKHETREGAEATLRTMFVQQMIDEHYTAKEIEKVWNNHTMFTAEV
jgi:hypothetical protein